MLISINLLAEPAGGKALFILVVELQNESTTITSSLVITGVIGVGGDDAGT